MTTTMMESPAGTNADLLLDNGDGDLSGSYTTLTAFGQGTNARSGEPPP